MLSFSRWTFAPIEAKMPVAQANNEHSKDITMYDSSVRLELAFAEKILIPKIERKIVIVDADTARGARCFHKLSDQVALRVGKNMIERAKEEIPKTKYTKERVKFVIGKSELLCLL